MHFIRKKKSVECYLHDVHWKKKSIFFLFFLYLIYVYFIKLSSSINFIPF